MTVYLCECACTRADMYARVRLYMHVCRICVSVCLCVLARVNACV